MRKTDMDLFENATKDAQILAPAMEALMNTPIRRDTAEAWQALLSAARHLQVVRQWYAKHLARTGAGHGAGKEMRHGH